LATSKICTKEAQQQKLPTSQLRRLGFVTSVCGGSDTPYVLPIAQMSL